MAIKCEVCVGRMSGVTAEMYAEILRKQVKEKRPPYLSTDSIFGRNKRIIELYKKLSDFYKKCVDLRVNYIRVEHKKGSHKFIGETRNFKKKKIKQITRFELMDI